MERAIWKMSYVIFRQKNGITAKDVDEEARIEAINLSAVVAQLQYNSHKICV